MCCRGRRPRRPAIDFLRKGGRMAARFFCVVRPQGRPKPSPAGGRTVFVPGDAVGAAACPRPAAIDQSKKTGSANSRAVRFRRTIIFSYTAARRATARAKRSGGRPYGVSIPTKAAERSGDRSLRERSRPCIKRVGRISAARLAAPRTATKNLNYSAQKRAFLKNS